MREGMPQFVLSLHKDLVYLDITNSPGLQQQRLDMDEGEHKWTRSSLWMARGPVLLEKHEQVSGYPSFFLPVSFCGNTVSFTCSQYDTPKNTLETEVAMWFFISNEDSNLQVATSQQHLGRGLFSYRRVLALPCGIHIVACIGNILMVY